jgi:hypothetical protein
MGCCYINILYWIIYELIFLSFIIPSFTMGGLIVNDQCLNNVLLPLYIWFFVYGSTYMILNMLTIPIFYMCIIKMKFNDCIPMWYKISAIITCILFVFSLSWLGFGVYIWNIVHECTTFIHATKLLLAYILIWLIILCILLILAIIIFVIYCVLKISTKK